MKPRKHKALMQAICSASYLKLSQQSSLAPASPAIKLRSGAKLHEELHRASEVCLKPTCYFGFKEHIEELCYFKELSYILYFRGKSA